MSARLTCLPLLAAAALAASAHAGSVIHVDPDAPGVQDGSSWTDAHHSLAAALADAVSGDEVRVAAGTYRPEGVGDTALWSFTVPAGVTLRGSFSGFGGANPDAQSLAALSSLLDGDHALDDVPFEPFLNRFDNSDHVLVLAAGAGAVRIEGFVVRGGSARAFGGGSDGEGGGLWCEGADLTLADCRFEDNTARTYGGGVFVGSGSTLTMARCVLDRNAVGGSGDGNAGGAGLAVLGSSLFLKDGAFTGNDADSMDHPHFSSGGGVYLSTAVPGGSSRIERTRFEGNRASEEGGGLFLNGAGHVVDCDFLDNEVGPGVAPFSLAHGGGASVYGSEQVQLLRCRFLGNRTETPGGSGTAIYTLFDVVISQCEIVGNGHIGSNSAPAVAVAISGRTLIDGCTIANNEHGGGGVNSAGLFLSTLATGSSVTNTILWGNRAGGATDQAAQVFSGDPTAVFQNDIVQGWTGSLGGSGNLDADPLFTDVDGADDVEGTLDDDVTLLPGSPAIDAGRSDALPADAADLDCDGDLTEAIPLDGDGWARRVDDPTVVDTGLGAPVVDIGAREAASGLPTDIWTDLGGASAGALGAPVLIGKGTFCEQQLVGLRLTNAPPGALVLLLESLEANPFPKWGGTLWTVPIFTQFLLQVDGTGTFDVEVPLLAALPPGLEVYYQFLVHDTTVSPPIILSNAVGAVTP